MDDLEGLAGGVLPDVPPEVPLPPLQAPSRAVTSNSAGAACHNFGGIRFKFGTFEF